jgi:hypothetical protein
MKYYTKAVYCMCGSTNMQTSSDEGIPQCGDCGRTDMFLPRELWDDPTQHLSAECVEILSAPTVKVLWLSRHPMTAVQTAELEAMFPASKLTIEARNITWTTGKGSQGNWESNKAILDSLIQEARVIAGVFPPVIRDLLPTINDCVLGKSSWLAIESISYQDASKRQGEGPIPFIHEYWQTIGSRGYCPEGV